jgi:hypothetical protein
VVVVELTPGAKAGSHHHAGMVFAYVIEGTVRSQLNGGEVIEYRAGRYWVEPSGAEDTLTQNHSRAPPARLLAEFIAPTGVRLTTYEKRRRRKPWLRNYRSLALPAAFVKAHSIGLF